MSASDHTPGLKLLDGGRVTPVSRMHRIFLDAYVTNTRLMGVLAIVAHWSIIFPSADRDDPGNWEDLSQFFYIDCEEAGFETYRQVRGCEEEDVIESERIENALVCGLGGDEIELNERELRLLLCSWARFNEEHGLPLPAGGQQYGFLLELQAEADPQEQQELMDRICVPINSDRQAIHYFLMRCFGRDYEGARYLCGSEDVPLDLYGSYVCATFYRNEVSYRGSSDDAAVYRCESLIEMNGAYEIIVSLVTLRRHRIIDLVHCDRLPITTAEAAMILRRNEFFSYYDVLLSDEDLEENIDEFTLGFRTTVSMYPNGRLFMRYRKNNDHVRGRIFLLNNDVEGMFFLTNNRQLVLCAYSAEDVVKLQRLVRQSPLGPYMEEKMPGRILRFAAGEGRRSGSSDHRGPAQSIMLEFMNSDCEDFEDFFLI